MSSEPVPATDEQVAELRRLAEAVSDAEDEFNRLCNDDSDLKDATQILKDAIADFEVFIDDHHGVLQLIARIEADGKRLAKMDEAIEAAFERGVESWRQQ